MWSATAKIPPKTDGRERERGKEAEEKVAAFTFRHKKVEDLMPPIPETSKPEILLPPQ